METSVSKLQEFREKNLSSENLTSQIIKEHVKRLLRKIFTVRDQYKSVFFYFFEYTFI